MLRYFLWGLVCLPAMAQVPAPTLLVNLIPATPFFAQLNNYLGLTAPQILQIAQNLVEYSQLVAQRQVRLSQVQSEIGNETAKSPLDPAALGVRYAEIESICRNVRDEAGAAQTRNLALLTDVQLAKLKILDDAMKLFPIITEAQNAGVLAPPGITGNGSKLLPNPVASFLIGYLPLVLSGCEQVPPQVN